MIKNFKCYILTISCILSINASLANEEITYVNIGPGVQFPTTYPSQPADADDYGKFIDSGSYTNIQACNSTNQNYNLARIDVLPTAPYERDLVSNGNYGAYQTGAKGWLSLARIVDYYNNQSYSYLNGGKRSVLTVPNLLDYQRKASNGVLISGRQYFSRGYDRQDPNENGELIIPSFPFYDLLCIDDKEVVRERIVVTMKQTIIKYEGFRTCTPDSNTSFIDLKTAPMTQFTDENILINKTSAQYSMTCDENILVYYSVSDQSDLSNISTIANLTSDSTAKGIGIALTGPTSFLSRGRLKFGPDGSAKGIPNQTQYLLMSTRTVKGQKVSLTLDFAYVKKPNEAIEAGTANALIGITYSYQ